jgi:hypothetical protein
MEIKTKHEQKRKAKREYKEWLKSERKKRAEDNRAKTVGETVAVIIIFLIILAFVQNGQNSSNSSSQNSSLANTTIADNVKAGVAKLEAQQQSCLTSARNTYDTSWRAKANSNNEVSYADGALQIEMQYYSDEISCYEQYDTPTSKSQISDLEQKRQQDSNTYNTWLEARNNAANNYHPSGSTYCHSSTLGGSVDTYCY